MKPGDAISPRSRLEILDVCYTAPDGSWSCADVLWDGSPCKALRWNGDIDDPADKGNPVSHGHATWFILPDELVPASMETIETLPQAHAYA